MMNIDILRTVHLVLNNRAPALILGGGTALTECETEFHSPLLSKKEKATVRVAFPRPGMPGHVQLST